MPPFINRECSCGRYVRTRVRNGATRCRSCGAGLWVPRNAGNQGPPVGSASNRAAAARPLVELECLSGCGPWATGAREGSSIRCPRCGRTRRVPVDARRPQPVTRGYANAGQPRGIERDRSAAARPRPPRRRSAPPAPAPAPWAFPAALVAPIPPGDRARPETAPESPERPRPAPIPTRVPPADLRPRTGRFRALYGFELADPIPAPGACVLAVNDRPCRNPAAESVTVELDGHSPYRFPLCRDHAEAVNRSANAPRLARPVPLS
jgi:hypothetical protein